MNCKYLPAALRTGSQVDDNLINNFMWPYSGYLIYT